MSKSDDEKYVNSLLKEFEKKNFEVSRASEMPDVEVIPTGLEELDTKVIGIGGIPRGKITQIWGPYASGKSTLTAQVAANMQKGKNYYNGTILVIDTEGKFDHEWWTKWEVDTSKVIKPDFTCGEEAYSIVREAIGKVDLVFMDSIASLVTRVAASREYGKPQKIANQALMNEDELNLIVNGGLDKKGNRLTTPLRNSKTALVFINQIRSNIGVMYGPTEKRKGGHSLDHLCSLILRIDDLKRKDLRTEDDWGGVIVKKIRIKCNRNNFGPPDRVCDVWLDTKNCKFDSDIGSFLVNTGEMRGILERRGAWLYCAWFDEDEKGDRKLQGTDKFMDFIEHHKKGQELKTQILNTEEVGEKDENKESKEETHSATW